MRKKNILGWGIWIGFLVICGVLGQFNIQMLYMWQFTLGFIVLSFLMVLAFWRVYGGDEK